ncbi:efflux RND transporter periplasmic adaptor subunit [Fulvivirga maritima]|uniref:efflux RND transporter periplasmic adaptor subunit n=1 Tax=Fulvivirga maritima TaxID=2904247 RepID=UPI001F2198B8|nr:efflux RND transporter periplasmic adaptor subunit [Fulvivirga maritima]UII25598.1 efflux RND transporter periplasmic adaptor subunit [Fulvivirga maritima]
MKRKYIIGLICVVLLVFIGVKLFFNKQKINEQNKVKEVEAILIPVKTDTASQRPITYTIIKTGNIIASKENSILTPIGGIVQKINFELGDEVKAGQTLAVIDNRTNQLELEKAKTQAAKLKNDLETYKELYEGKAATKEKVDELQQSYNEALNTIDQLKKQVGDAYVKAPISGTIATKPIEEGVYASAGTELTKVVNLSSLKVEVNLTETEAYQVSKGQQVTITTDIFPGKQFNGKLTFISPTTDDGHNYPAEVTLENSAEATLKSGTFVYADLSKSLNETTLAIPRSALMENLDKASVYLVKDDKAVLQQIETGRDLQDYIEVLQGLQAGDIIVTTGQINLQDGTQVRIAN